MAMTALSPPPHSRTPRGVLRPELGSSTSVRFLLFSVRAERPKKKKKKKKKNTAKKKSLIKKFP
eukprot:NODE_17217_length_955_cov_3.897343.p7 GENE.NODE_17217_length_955_cov_3.897343~~NODE_17217_length_955_cov_3.897343.p7  ORF type:complete len:64 (-),score=30.12 NODE_17217_length_955_cov_3.897343:57-248(-)